MSLTVLISQIIREVTASTMNSKPDWRSPLTLLQTIRQYERAALGDTLIETLDFQNGHKRELIETLGQMQGSSKTKKYPLIYLVQDLVEDRGGDPTMYASVNLNIIIAHQTVDTYKITDREQKVFIPVLYPIYKQFMKMIVKHPLVHNYPDPKHRKIDRSYWGRTAVGGNDQNMITDFVDAIEIQNLQLNINFKNC